MDRPMTKLMICEYLRRHALSPSPDDRINEVQLQESLSLLAELSGTLIRAANAPVSAKRLFLEALQAEITGHEQR